MATRGRKRTATVVRLVTGIPANRPPTGGEPIPNGRPTPPVPLNGRPLALWRRYIGRAWWLTEFDAPKAFMWVHMQAEFEANPACMTAARIGQLRAVGSELGLDPSSRQRMGGDKPPVVDELERFFT